MFAIHLSRIATIVAVRRGKTDIASHSRRRTHPAPVHMTRARKFKVARTKQVTLPCPGLDHAFCEISLLVFVWMAVVVSHRFHPTMITFILLSTSSPPIPNPEQLTPLILLVLAQRVRFPAAIAPLIPPYHRPRAALARLRRWFWTASGAHRHSIHGRRPCERLATTTTMPSPADHRWRRCCCCSAQQQCRRRHRRRCCCCRAGL